MLAMVRYPDVYKRAQDEIDRVIGRERLPTIDDRPSLPYLEWKYSGKHTIKAKPPGLVHSLHQMESPISIGPSTSSYARRHL